MAIDSYLIFPKKEECGLYPRNRRGVRRRVL
jgi:hypothetical protein